MHQNSEQKTPFLVKLNSILEENKYSDMICWDQTKTMIDILDEKRIQTEILPHFFRHRKFESFIRQLNLYGFRKIKKTNAHRFKHQSLTKGGSIFSIRSQRKQKNSIENHANSEQIQKSFEEIPKEIQENRNKIALCGFAQSQQKNQNQFVGKNRMNFSQSQNTWFKNTLPYQNLMVQHHYNQKNMQHLLEPNFMFPQMNVYGNSLNTNPYYAMNPSQMGYQHSMVTPNNMLFYN